LKNTFIARASDGLILCETYDSVTDSKGKYLFNPSNTPKATKATQGIAFISRFTE
jgi:hypothetical protein